MYMPILFYNIELPRFISSFPEICFLMEPTLCSPAVGIEQVAQCGSIACF
jgi:hypothetical protein